MTDIERKRETVAQRVKEAQDRVFAQRALVNSLPLASPERAVALNALGAMRSVLENLQEQYHHVEKRQKQA
jgi:hypothetical protein